jgi:hypothetical protein
MIVSGLTGCISDFVPKMVAENPAILVVDGTITNGETIIKLSESKDLTDNSYSINYVNTATVLIETAHSTAPLIAQRTEPGHYVFKQVQLHPDSMYRLRIFHNNEVYLSELLRPLITPEIDSLTWRKTAKGEPIEIMAHAADKLNQSRFYRWTFSEIWEYKSPLYANVGFVNGKLVFYDERDTVPNPKYYCWKRAASTKLILESSARLRENIIRNKVIHSIEPTDNRVSELYFIEVKQYLIRKEAYDYFSNLQRNIDDMGSIFAPVPSEMLGNIRCITADIPAIGYVDVTTNTRIAKYISGLERLYEHPRRNCEIFDEPTSGALPYYFNEETRAVVYASAECIDCTELGGNKNKPLFWPNDHQ